MNVLYIRERAMREREVCKERFWNRNLVGDSLSLADELPVASWSKLRLKSSLASESSLALTSGDRSECSDSELLSWSELTERPLRKEETRLLVLGIR